MSKYEKCKIGLLGIFVLGFLFCCYEFSQNGRYVALEYKTLDSRTGEIYYYGSREKICIDNFKEKKKE
jgi:hypothetical protein